MSGMTSRISFRRLDHDTSATWFAQALQLMGTAPLHAWCDDERRSGKTGLLIADDVQGSAVSDFVTRWPRGRLFTPAVDLRWEHLSSGAIHTVLIADGTQHEQLGMGDMLPLAPTSAERHLILWGEYRDNAWREERIPNLASYLPKTWKGPHAVLRVQPYVAPWPGQNVPTQPKCFAAERQVVRYLAYDGNFPLKDDPRFQQDITAGVT